MHYQKGQNFKEKKKREPVLKIKHSLISAFRFSKRAILRYLKEDITVKAAGLAFYKLLTLIPIIMLLFYILGKVLNNTEIFYRVLKTLTIFEPEIQSVVMKNIKQIMQTSFLTAIFGFFLFFFLTRKYLRELLFAVRKIIGENPNRPKTLKASIFRYIDNYLRQLLYILLYVIAIGFGEVMSAISSNLFGILGKLISGGTDSGVSTVLSILLLIFPVTSNTFLFYMIYRHAPDYKPAKRYALIGALFTAISTQILFYLYKLYIETFLFSVFIYGPLTAVAALIIWYWLDSMVILFGAVIVYLLNEGKHKDWVI